jgi:hypothetical protein
MKNISCNVRNYPSNSNLPSFTNASRQAKAISSGAGKAKRRKDDLTAGVLPAMLQGADFFHCRLNADPPIRGTELKTM